MLVVPRGTFALSPQHAQQKLLHRWAHTQVFVGYNQHVWPRPIYTLCSRGSNGSQEWNVELYV